MTLLADILKKPKKHSILFSSILSLTLLWGPTASADPVDAVADIVFGQTLFTTNTCNLGGVSASSLCSARDVAVDTSGNVYVADAFGSRVLVYLDPLNTDTVADVVFGQPDFVSNAADNGGMSASSLDQPDAVVVDLAGNVYVADTRNSRVLIYFDPLNTDLVADVVLGQSDFVTRVPNLSASGLSRPVRIDVDAAGNVYVADFGDSRVLVYLDPINTDTIADLVLGQPDFTSNAQNNGGVSASSLARPSGVRVDQVGNVYVADRNNHRVLVYLDPLNTDTFADVVLGQPDFTSNAQNNGGVSASSLDSPSGVYVDAIGNVYIADSSNHRVLEYHTPLTTDTVADVVLGQPDFTSNTQNNGGVSATSLSGPWAVDIDAAGNVYVVDRGSTTGYWAMTELHQS